MPPHEPTSRSLIAPAVQTALDGLRRRIRRYVWLEGLGGAVAWLGVAFWTMLLADWLFEPRPSVRALMLASAIAVLLAILWQLIGRRAMVRISDSNAATLLERRFPQLDDSLLTAVSLAARDGDEVDRHLLDATCRQAASRLATVEIDRVFNPRPLRSKCIAGGLLAISVAVFAFWANSAFALWARRTLALSDEIWPRTTRLEVDGFDTGVRKVARGSDFEVIAKADTRMPRIPQVVEIRYRTDDSGIGRSTMDRRGVARPTTDRYQQYAYTFRGILSDIHFDVLGGDDYVLDRWIQVVDSPTVTTMTLDCDFPEYIGRKPTSVPITGVMQVPAGSRVTVRAATNKTIQRAIAWIDSASAPPTADRAIRQPDRHDCELTSDRRGFSYALGSVSGDVTLLLSLTDDDAITSRDPIRLALVAVPDQAPQLSVQLDGIGAAITPQARIPVVGRITDDYGLAKAWFEHAEGQRPPTIQDIRRFSPPPTEFSLADAALEVRDSGLAAGQKLTLAVKAADLCDLGHAPNIGSSERWTLDIVTPEQLRAVLDARELVLRQRLDASIQEMTETRDLLTRLDFSTVEAARLPPKGSEPDDEPEDSPAHQSTLRLLRVQGALTNCRKSTQEVLGIADAVDDIRKQLINNRIDTEELKARLQGGIADPLRQVATSMFPDLETRLERLSPALTDSTHGPERRDLARQQADAILAAMRAVLARMIELEDFNQAVELLRNIITSQTQLQEATRRRQKDKVRDLLDDAPKANSNAQDSLAEQQKQVAEKYEHFEQVLLRMAELAAATDPRKAALLKKVIAQSKDQLIAVRLRQLVDLLDKEQLARALEQQIAAEPDLRSLLELLLSENRQKNIENEKARIREYLKRISSILNQQKDIQGRTAGDDDARRLAGEQRNVAEKTAKLANDIHPKQRPPSQSPADKSPKDAKPQQGAPSPKPSPGGGQAEGQGKAEGDSSSTEKDQSPAAIRARLEAARQRMKEAEERLKAAEREKASDKQEEAIRQLQLAKSKLEEILRQLREEEIERTLTMLEARFLKILQMQEEVYEGTVRLDKVPSNDRTHNHEIEASRLSTRESEIVAETERALLLLRDDGTAVAMQEAAGQARDDMQQIVQRLAQAKVGKATQDIEKDVLAALKEMVDALKKAKKNNESRQKSQQQPGGPPQDPPLVDALAELRMIRALQMRINTRTVRYATMIEGEQADNADLLDALKRLAERQKRVYQVTHELEMGKNQ